MKWNPLSCPVCVLSFVVPLHDDQHLCPKSVPEEQEVSIEFVVNSVLKALEKNREKQRQQDSSLAPFSIKVEVRIGIVSPHSRG
jgi:hypothetical protein